MRKFLFFIFIFFYSVSNAQQVKIADSFDNVFNVCIFPTPAKFPGGIKGWGQYLRKNTNSALGNKYLVIPKNKKFVKATVFVNFRVSKYGYVDSVFVKDSTNVHPKLVAEAIRIVKASPRWIPSKLNGKNVVYLNRQAITWQVDKD